MVSEKNRVSMDAKKASHLFSLNFQYPDSTHIPARLHSCITVAGETNCLQEHVSCKDVETDQDENQATDDLHFVAKNIFKPLTEHHTGK